MCKSLVVSESTSNLTVASLYWYIENMKLARKYEESNPLFSEDCQRMAEVWLWNFIGCLNTA